MPLSTNPRGLSRKALLTRLGALAEWLAEDSRSWPELDRRRMALRLSPSGFAALLGVKELNLSRWKREGVPCGRSRGAMTRAVLKAIRVHKGVGSHREQITLRDPRNRGLEAGLRATLCDSQPSIGLPEEVAPPGAPPFHGILVPSRSTPKEVTWANSPHLWINVPKSKREESLGREEFLASRRGERSLEERLDEIEAIGGRWAVDEYLETNRLADPRKPKRPKSEIVVPDDLLRGPQEESIPAPPAGPELPGAEAAH